MQLATRAALACLILVAPAMAADTPPASLTAAADASVGRVCRAPIFRQFDFWLGRWTVTNPGGVVVGHSRIALASGGCAIHELWLGRRSTGNSLSYYDHASGRWHQDWVGSGGQVLHLKGALKGTAMVLEGRRRDRKGDVLDRITWTPLPGHRVRQHWQTSRDGGVHWSTLFLGTYAPEPTTDTP